MHNYNVCFYYRVWVDLDDHIKRALTFLEQGELNCALRHLIIADYLNEHQRHFRMGGLERTAYLNKRAKDRRKKLRNGRK